MFEIMQENVIRVSVYVPQDTAFGGRPASTPSCACPNFPITGSRERSPRIVDALQPGTRSMLIEVDIPNPDGALPPGIYCTVELLIPRKTPSLSIPADALIFNRDGMQVAVVSNGKAEFRKVGVKRDLGTRVEVDSGIKAGRSGDPQSPGYLRRRRQGTVSPGAHCISQIVLRRQEPRAAGEQGWV